MATKIKTGVLKKASPSEIAYDDSDNCRSYGHRQDHIDWLAESMFEDGQVHPIRVRILPDGSLKLSAGSGRLKAGLKIIEEKDPNWKISYVASTLNAAEAYKQSVRENIHAGLSEIEQAISLRRLTDEYGMTQAVAARHFPKMDGKSPTSAWASNRIRLLKLCEDARLALHNGDITLTAAMALTKMSEDEQREHLNPQASIPATELQTAETGETGETEPTVAPVTTTQGETRHQRSERIQAASGKPKKLTMQRFLTDDLLCLRKDAHEFNFIELAAFLDTMNAYVERETEYDDLRDAMLAVAKKCGYTIEDL